MDIQHLKEKLEAEKRVLEKELGSLGQKNPDVKGDWEATPLDTTQEADDNVQADHYEELAERSGVGAELENRLVDVNHALKKMNDNTYGVCEISGEPIEGDRLDANPAARTCKKHINEII